MKERERKKFSNLFFPLEVKALCEKMAKIEIWENMILECGVPKVLLGLCVRRSSTYSDIVLLHFLAFLLLGHILLS